ncbi:Replication factor C subunit 5 [Oopsacas minuta]|uniref:Replication factor C subunit 5 n=1 Tax=Oopsacas minuta TaxID=111878 RepID=A0AAV7JJQ4_9METZ|nr:Replication factor C subunit 5 [Oopsacas minuta]
MSGEAKLAHINVPWVEKYRPSSLDEIVSHEEIVRTLDTFLSQGMLPHLLFYGPPGTGKTSTVLACAKRLYKSKEFSSMVLELNASDDRGIGTVRGPILNFASTRTIFSSGFKLIILDEADAMTKDAQNALRRILEKFTENVRFCLICNSLHRIIPAIQSRCTRFRFGPLDPELMVRCVRSVAEKEDIPLPDSGLEAILRLSHGDMRRALNTLQASHLAHESVDQSAVYSCTGQPQPIEIEGIVSSMLNDTFCHCLNHLSQVRSDRGLALSDILTESHLLLLKIEMPDKIKAKLIGRLSDIEYATSGGGNEKLQLSGMIGAFQEARDSVAMEGRAL